MRFWPESGIPRNWSDLRDKLCSKTTEAELEKALGRGLASRSICLS